MPTLRISLGLLLSLSMIGLVGCKKDKVKNVKGTITTEIVHSSIVNDDYRIYIYLPPDYDSSRNYETIFQLDADYQFDGLVSTIEDMVSANKITPKILIGIGYPGDDHRDRDYTISAVSGAQSGAGGASEFYDFLTQELMDYVETKFPTSSSATLVGHSLGGLFVYYALFNQNKSIFYFQNFVAQSPSLWWDGGKIFELTDSNQIRSAKLYSCVGQYENSTMRSLSDEMKRRFSQTPYVDSKFSLIKEASHTDTKTNNQEAYEFIFN